MFSKRNPSNAEKIRHRIPTPHTSRISKSITQTSGLNVSHITDVSTNPTDELFHHSAISQQSSRSKRSSTMRKKTKRRRSQKAPVNPLMVGIDTSDSADHWLDLSFLDRQCTQEDYLCNYWRYTVAAEQSMRLDYFLNAIDAHECKLWEGFSDDYVPSWAKFMEVRHGWEGSDERKWQSGGWTRGEKGIEWRPGHVMLRVPNNDWIGGSHEDLDDCTNVSSRKWVDDDIYVHIEDREDYGVIDVSSPERGRQLYREQGSKPRRPVKRTVEPRLIIPHVTSTSFILDIPPTHQEAPILPSIPSSQMLNTSRRPPSLSKHDSRTAKISRVSYAPLLAPDRTGQFSHRPRRIFTPAPTRVSSEHANDEVTQKNQEIAKLLRFLKMNTEQKVAEIHRLARSMRRGT